MSSLHREKLEAFARAHAGGAIPDGTPPAGDIAATVSSLLIDDESSLTAAEVALGLDILACLYAEIAEDARRRLAQRLAARDDVPRHLAVMLAHDRLIDVARPVLVASPVLEDDDLIAVIAERSWQHRLAITGRRRISSRVVDALASLQDVRIAVGLANNPGAELSEYALRALIGQARSIPALHEPLVGRRELDRELAGVLVHWIGADLRARIAETFGEDLALKVSGDVSKASHAAAVRMFGEPEPMHLIEALRAGRVRALEEEVAALTGLPPVAVSRVLYSPDGQALAVLARALGLPRSLFREFYGRLNGTSPFGSAPLHRELAEATARFDALSRAQANSLLAQWRNSPAGVWGSLAQA